MEIVHRTSVGFDRMWAKLWAVDPYQHPIYLPKIEAYYRECSQSLEYSDHSFVLVDNEQPVIGISLGSGSTGEITSYGRPVFSIVDPVRLNQNRVSKVFAREIERILGVCPRYSIKYTDFLTDGKISLLGEYLLRRRATVSDKFVGVIELAQGEREIYRSIRKSYKSLINWGRKNLESKILVGANIRPHDIDAFRMLHIQESGRETRSKKTWELQYEAVKNGEAFVILGELDRELVTAGFFLYSDKTCFYGVSASRRDLFKKPMFHNLMWQAILHAKIRGCLYFETGEQLFACGEAGQKKDLDIGLFKKGFGGDTNVRIQMILENVGSGTAE